jgi:hypothetical protein
VVERLLELLAQNVKDVSWLLVFFACGFGVVAVLFVYVVHTVKPKRATFSVGVGKLKVSFEADAGTEVRKPPPGAGGGNA